MSPRTKRFLTYLLLFILAGLLTLIAVWFLTRPQGDGTGTDDDGGGFSLFPQGNQVNRPTGPSRPGFDPNVPSVGTNFNRRMPRLRMISGEPVAGYLPFETVATTTLAGTTTTTSFENAVVYTQRVSGHMYVARESTEAQTRLTNTTIPKVYQAQFSSSTAALYRYLADDGVSIRTFYGSIASGTSEFTGTFLTNNIDSVALSADGKQMIYTMDRGDQFFLNRSNIDGSAMSTIFNSYIKEWNVQWPQQSKVFLTSKADSRYPGVLYVIDPATRRFDKLLSDILGLATLANPDGSRVAVSYTDPNNDFGFAIFNVAERDYAYPNFRTIAEKCVWSKIDTSVIYCAAPLERVFESMPEAWYMGKISTMDTIFRLDTDDMSSVEILTQIGLEGNDLDIDDMALSKDESFLYFINKRDLTLWSYEIDPPQGPSTE